MNDALKAVEQRTAVEDRAMDLADAVRSHLMKTAAAAWDQGYQVGAAERRGVTSPNPYRAVVEILASYE